MKYHSWLFLVLFILLTVEYSHALPRFALMTGAKCGSCHVNPTGGQMRNEYGINYSQEKLPLEAMKDSEFTFTGKLNDNISIGGDYRSQFIYDIGSRTSSFQAMTTSIYGSVRLNKKYSFFFKQDIVNGTYGYGNPFPGTEVFGLAKILPGDWYIKGGIFLPEYGWRIDDHTGYTRGGDLGYTNNTLIQRGLIFTPNYKDIGIEIGGYISGISVTGGIFNGDGDQTQIHLTNKKAYALKTEYMRSASDLNFRLGLSAYGYNIMTMKGVNVGFGIGDFVILGEIDWTNNYMIDTLLNPNGKTMAAFAEADYRAMQGLWLIGKFDTFDPIQGIEKNELKRITLGLEFFPYAFFEVRPQFRINIEDPSIDNNQMLIQAHVWF